MGRAAAGQAAVRDAEAEARKARARRRAALARLRKAARPFLPIALVVAAALLLYTVRLDSVSSSYFDETRYLLVTHQMASGVLENPCPTDHLTGDVAYLNIGHLPVNFEHPPLAKEILAWSVGHFDARIDGLDQCIQSGTPAFQAFQFKLLADGHPYAWRLPGALMGVVAVAFASLAARRLFGSTAAGAAAGALMLADGLLFTSARMVDLDIFALGFAMAALWCATHARRRALVGAGLLLGLAFACKYSSLFAGPPVLLVALWAHHREGKLGLRRAGQAAACLVGLPAVLWPASYLPWWRLWVSQHGLAWAVGHWVRVQAAAFQWDASGAIRSLYASRPSTWWTLGRPALYFTGRDLGSGAGASQGVYIYGIGNPALWWVGAAAAVAVLVVAARALGRALLARPKPGTDAGTEGTPAPRFRLPGTAADQALAVACLLPGLAYAPFLLLQRNGFLYYMVLVVPFLAIALAGVLLRLWRRNGRLDRPACIGVGFLVLAAFVRFFPLLAGLPLTPDQKDALLHTIPWMQG